MAVARDNGSSCGTVIKLLGYGKAVPRKGVLNYHTHADYTSERWNMGRIWIRVEVEENMHRMDFRNSFLKSSLVTVIRKK